jgi:hypothetical protein
LGGGDHLLGDARAITEDASGRPVVQGVREI